MEIEIIGGDAARRRLDDSRFVQDWTELAQRDPKFTLLQEPAFVLAWYRAYAEEQAPLLALGREQGELVGILPLARKGDRIRHAGGDQAEYHGWIADPEHDERFPVEALVALRREVRFASWKWRWAPPGTPLGWLDAPELRAAGIHAAKESRPSPIWDLRDPAKLKKVLSNRSLKAKANRYRRQGELRLERVRDPERTAELLKTLARQCDVRQEVIHGVRPFADDARKEAFFQARQSFPESNHFSVLWLDDKPLAFHFGGCDGRTCLLGLSSYAPAESRNSPGGILIMELARRLSEEGFERLDLTPGTDPYKQRFANGEQVLTRITLHGSKARWLRSRWKSGLRGALQRASSSRELAAQDRFSRWQRGVQRAVREISRNGVAQGLRAVRKQVHVQRELVLLRRGAAAGFRSGKPGDNGAAGCSVTLQDDAVLTSFDFDSAFSSRRDFFADALERFSEGQVLHSVQADRGAGAVLLAWCTTLSKGPMIEAATEAGIANEKTRIASGFSLAGGVVDEAAIHAAIESIERAAEADGVEELLVAIDARTPALAACVRDMGYEPMGCAQVRRRLGTTDWQFQGEAERSRST